MLSFLQIHCHELVVKDFLLMERENHPLRASGLLASIDFDSHLAAQNFITDRSHQKQSFSG